MRRLTLAITVACLLAGSAPAWADYVNHQKPQGPAKARFAPEFPALTDHEWGWAIGGFGGIRKGAPIKHVPVIFVHGNDVDHGDWYPVRDDFTKAGWTNQELWALSYNGIGTTLGSGSRSNPEATDERVAEGADQIPYPTGNDVNVPDLYDFIHAVQAYTGSKKFSIVSHSLGVTVARKTLKVHKELRDDLVAFVGIAGGNHGTSLCPPGSENVLFPCNEVVQGSPWLADLNGSDGSDETYAPAKWMTVYDGSGTGDVSQIGPTYAKDPVLKGADNREFAGKSHNDLRLDPAIISVYRTFIEGAERHLVAVTKKNPTTTVRVLGRTERLPATGLGTPFALAFSLIGVGLLGAVVLVVRRPR